MNLELAAMRWLWLDKGCHYVIQERTPKFNAGQPDVLGVTRDRHLIEIEIKRSAADFHADAKKHHRVNRHMSLSNQPRQFYYLMEIALAQKVKDKIPEWAGLLQLPFRGGPIEVVKMGPVNKDAARLEIRECVRLARMMVAHMMSVSLRNEAIRNRFVDGGPDFTDYADPKNRTYNL